jgi:hypothetical protein
MIRIVKRFMLNRYEPKSLGDWLKGVLGAPKEKTREENEENEEEYLQHDVNEDERNDESSDDDDRHGGIKIPIPVIPGGFRANSYISSLREIRKF